MIFLSAADTEAVFDWNTAVACIQSAYATDSTGRGVPGRLVAADKSAWIRCMPAIPASGRYMGSKQIARTRAGKVTYLITLYDKESGELAFLIDAIAITSMRTASTSVSALNYLSRGKPLRIGLIGSGLEARMHAQAICHRHKVEEIVIYSPTVANREKLAADLNDIHGVKTSTAGSAREAMKDANCAVAAARSRDESPLLYAEWLAPGTIVLSIGSTTPSQREVDISVIARAGLIVTDVPDELSQDTGDMQAATAAGIAFDSKLMSLHDLVQGRIPAGRLDADLVMFKSVGSALQDIAFAEMIADAALVKGLGTNLALGLSVKQSIGKNV